MGKAAKPEPPIALPVSEVSVEVWREASAAPPERWLSWGPSRVILGLGSNIGDRRAAPAGGGRPRSSYTACRVLACSSVYDTEPVGLVLDQPDVPQRMRGRRD